MKRIGLPLTLLLFGAVSHLAAQTTHSTSAVSINAGDPGWASFYFSDVPGGGRAGYTGDTVLIIQCDFNRAELILHFDEYGGQLVSPFFPVSCTANSPKSYVLNGTPFTIPLVLQGVNYDGQPVTEKVTLTLDSASWEMLGYGRWAKDVGSAQIAY